LAQLIKQKYQKHGSQKDTCNPRLFLAKKVDRSFPPESTDAVAKNQ